MKFSEIREFGRPYVVAELGANHNGDMDLARKLIDSAKECGADCVKFQSWTTHSTSSKIVYENNYFLSDDYRNRTDTTLEEICDKYQLSSKQHHEMKDYCEKVGIDFASTPFSKSEVDLLVDELNVEFIKIASMDLNNYPFLKYVAGKGKPVVISDGLCGLDDVVQAVDCLRSNGCNDIILLHCVSIYPPEDDQINLNNIDMLRTVFGIPVGYSDHSIGTLAPIMAMAKGVCIIEKHFTLDKSMEGWDHKISADPSELKVICDAAKVGYKMLGSYSKVISENQERRNAFQRSIVTTREIKKGHVFTEDDLTCKRPGTGIPPKYVDFLIGREAKRDISEDEIVKMSDF